MDPITWIVVGIIAGLGTAYGYEKYKASKTATEPTGADQFTDANCKAQYNAMNPTAKDQIDAAIAEANADGGAVGAAKLAAAAAIIRPGYPNLADCLSAKATVMNGGVAPPVPTSKNTAASVLTGECLTIYQGLDPYAKAAVDNVLIQADGMSDAKAAANLIAAHAAQIAPFNPKLAACLNGVAAAVAAKQSGTGTHVGAGADLFTGTCLDTYHSLDEATASQVDAAATAAKNAGGGAAGAKILASAALAYISINPNLYGCLLDAATRMNGGTMPDLGTGGDVNALHQASTLHVVNYANKMIRATGTAPNYAPFKRGFR